MDTSEFLECSKENVKPLAKGRKALVLGTALQAEEDDELRHYLLKKRDEYELQLRCYNGDDPLQVWFDYVNWVEQNFPKNGREGNYQVLLERCLSEFQDQKRYNEDERYVSMWIRYLNQLAIDPLELYKQVHAHGIGTQCAIYYENWAETLERSGDFKRADKVYVEGIKRKAQPLQELEFAHARFQVRVARRVLDDNSGSPEPLANDKRSAMAVLKPHGRKNVVNNVRVGSNVQRTTPGVLLPLNSNSREKKGNIQTTGRGKIFNDENADFNDVVSDHIIKTSGPISQKDHIWKENAKKPGRWNEGKFKQNVPVPSHNHPSFPVHIDENADVPNTPRGVNVAVNALKPIKYDDEALIPVARFEPPDPTKRPMYPKHKVYCGGTEFSLEELRAIVYNERYEKKMRYKEVQERSKAMESSEHVPQQEKDLSCGTRTSIDEIHVIRSRVEDVSSHKLVKEEFKLFAQHSVSQEMGSVNSDHSNPKVSTSKSIINDEYSNGNSLSDPSEREEAVEPESQHDADQLAPIKKNSAPSFTLYVDDGNDMNELEANLSLHRNSVTEKQEKAGRSSFSAKATNLLAIPGRGCLATELKVPKPFHRMVEEETEPVEVCGSSETPNNSGGNSRIEQSFTVNTKEAMKAVHGLWKSPQFENSSFVQLPPQQSKPAFTIHMDGSTVQEGCLEANGAKCQALVPSARQFLSFKKPNEPYHLRSKDNFEEPCNGTENVVMPDQCALERSSNKQEKDVFKMPLLPFVPSPGRTRKELDEMGADDKENCLSAGPKPPRIYPRSSANVLQPSRHIPFQPIEDWRPASEQEDDDLGVGPLCPEMSDETCTTQAFSRTLLSSLSSTPFSKNSGEVISHQVEKFGVENLDGSYCCPNAPVAQNELREECIKTSSAVPQHTTPRHVVTNCLSVIMETSKDKSSSSGSGASSTKRINPHWNTFENLDHLMESSPEVNKEVAAKFSNVTEDQEQTDCIAYPLSPSILSNLLTEIQFPDERHQEQCVILGTGLPLMQQKLTVGSEEYRFFSEPRGKWNGIILNATEMKSGRVISLKVSKQTCLWEFYISEEIQRRLRYPALALYFMSIEKAYIYTTGNIVLTEHSQYGNLLEIAEYLLGKDMDLPPRIVTYWTYEMLQIVQHLHKCQIIHGNLWCVNFYLHNIPFEMNGKPSLKLKNFEQAIDMTLFPHGTKFRTTGAALLGLEPLFQQACSYEMDFYKMAASVYYLLFSCSNMKVDKRNGKWACCPPSFNQNFWTTLFSELLNNEKPDITFLQKSIIQQSDDVSLFRDFRMLRDILSK
ncbi:mitotic checkpoint serine/threonine-protein kinase BUB1 [Anabrus simplex]|uniref:mitotic checkpoint serine/threonine-protein kinase BUB1 n=1 Tax=Anabrus simplex TaxID=316456 RepID=UPI0035A30101